MYLKSLEIQGFKSFADKTVLTFDHDITAIVGPNGSGKSNISDAIRWVMGEQSSKSLRGAKMEDVIFGGTQKRPALGFAEVSLILDNSDNAFRVDGAEVMVTRRYYRSGESEYYINKQSARLRDVNELFMDTGLGREGYSNIGQGKIDEILAVKSTDRREIFEEAAGISKYRHRKEDTEHRLAQTEENLLRIGDKISELELQVEPLRKQAEVAKKYLACKEELRGLEITTWLDSLDRIKEASAQIATDFEISQKQLEDAHGTLNGLYSDAEQLALQLHAKDLELEEVRTKIAATEANIQRANGEKAILENNLRNSRENINRLKTEIEEQATRTGGLAAQIEEKQKRVAELLQESGRVKLQEEQTQKLLSEKQQEVLQQTELLLQRQEKQQKLLEEISDLRTQEGSLQQLQNELSSRRDRLGNDASTSEDRLAKLQEEADLLHKKLASAQDTAAAEKNRLAGFQLRMKNRTARREELAKEHSDRSVELKTVESRIRMYREMERDYDGFSKAVRELMQEAGRGTLKNIHGPISRLIHVATEYTVAIETAMGGAMQNIVVSREEDAKAAISYLKQRDLGRATFLPLSAIRGRVLQERGLEEEVGFVGIASQLVQTEDRYRAVVEDLLGRTAIVDTLDHAISIARHHASRFRIVTLDGQVMNMGGSMTGGSAAKSSGILARDNALRQYTAKQKELTQTLEQLTKELQEASRLAEQTAYELNTSEEKLREAQDLILRLEGDCKQYDAVIEAAVHARDTVSSESSELAERLESTAVQLKLIQKNLQEKSDQMKQYEEETGLASQTQQEMQQCVEEQTRSLTELQMQANNMETERASCEASIKELRLLEVGLQGDRTQRKALISKYEQDEKDAQAQCEATVNLIAEAEEQAERDRAAQKELQSQRGEIEAKKTSSEREIQEKNKQILLLERETARLEQKKTTSDLEQNQLIDRLWDSYALTYSTAQSERVEIASAADASRKISSLKQKISGFGTPNLGAIDEYERVNERYSYLTGQRDDVLRSRKDLEGIIASITGEMQEIFVQKFAEINTYFAQTFVEMFGGGKAALQLEDPNCPLECGIEIRVQPPGKQLKTITLLSGGEKAFVAIALYFAILRVRPTPFCMLDEIDAALDERNVSRFAAYLRNLCQKTQFIVITHRRGTMEACDVLYGVTMQEQGVSRIIGIDLNQMQQELGIE